MTKELEIFVMCFERSTFPNYITTSGPTLKTHWFVGLGSYFKFTSVSDLRLPGVVLLHSS